MPLGTRRFDLYDFFSVFIPGAILLIGLLPFLPHDTNTGPLTGLLPILIGGYVVGRGIHSIAAEFDERGGTHRSQFFKQLNDGNPPEVSKNAVKEFLKECDAAFGSTIYEDDKGDKEPWERELAKETLYSAVRSYIHLDGRGRSRTFQAIYAFHRTMWIVVILLGGVYVSYSVGRMTGEIEDIVQYTSYIRDIGLDPLLIILLSFLGFGGSFVTFRHSKRAYRRLFAEYLILDFITIQSASEQSSGGGQPGAATSPTRAAGDSRSQPQDGEETE